MVWAVIIRSQGITTRTRSTGVGLVRSADSLEPSTACDHRVASRMQRRTGVTTRECLG
jgi:hypothetical protein